VREDQVGNEDEYQQFLDQIQEEVELRIPVNDLVDERIDHGGAPHQVGDHQ
jgi:hypothetical protein